MGPETKKNDADVDQHEFNGPERAIPMPFLSRELGGSPFLWSSGQVPGYSYRGPGFDSRRYQIFPGWIPGAIRFSEQWVRNGAHLAS
jgi:hypothetical protein